MTPSSPRILIIDDDLDIRETLADVLEDEGFATITAPNGLEALRLLRGAAPTATRPSVILLDLMMPVMDGYGFLEERKKDPAISSIPVAIITAGHGVEPDRLGNGTPIVPKPIDVPRLVSILHQLESGRASST